jgi:septal ring factor EnvC (AmiA/AmiB activator)
VLALAVPAHAGRRKPHPEPAKIEMPDFRALLADQLGQQADAIATALSTIGDKLAAADEVRLRRLTAAARLVRAPLGPDASDGERMESARRKAAARLLLDRDSAERGLLADEASRLAVARGRIAGAAEDLPKLALPTELARPVGGTIARHFGPFKHDGSHVQLARRGLDFEVDEHAAVIAPAEGTVRYAGPIRGLDHGVILDHGDYYTVVAKLAELSLPVGTHVARGDRLGRASRHRVYLEVRVKLGAGGLPIDPEPLLAH